MIDARNATPAETLEQRIMDPCAAKSEAEWWAHREIAKQRAENERLRENVDRLGKEVERADRLRAEIARVKADEKKNRAEIERLTRERDEARYFLKIFVHAHASNNAVPPHIKEQARKALEAKP